jgi:hypothetical protein
VYVTNNNKGSNMKNVFAIIVMASAITACGPAFKGDTGPQGPAAPTPTVPTPTVDALQQDIDLIVNDENNYRNVLGQTNITAGLSCQVAEVVSGSYLSSANGTPVISTSGKPTYTYLYKGLFNQPNSVSGASNLLPPKIQDFYINKNYRIICSGFIVVLNTDYYQFESKSDDGSLVIINGVIVVNNDGNHGMNPVAVTGYRFLRRGIHSFQVQYAQTGGNFGFILTAGGAPIDPRFYQH